MRIGLLETLALAALGLLLGRELVARVRLFRGLCLPEPVLGGLVLCAILTGLEASGMPTPEFDLSLQTPFMIAFFLSIGWMASWRNLRSGGPEVLWFLLLCSGALVLQNLAGMFLAGALGQPVLLGVLAGSVSLTGGPGTALAFAPAFEKAGIPGAAPIGTACALLGIMLGGLLGAPLSASLLRRLKVTPQPRSAADRPEKAPSAELAREAAASAGALERHARSVELGVLETAETSSEPGWNSGTLRTHLQFFLLVMAVGSFLGKWMQQSGLTLPIYIGSMLVAATLRNLLDARSGGSTAAAKKTQNAVLSAEAIEEFGSISLSYFLVVATMTLQLGKLAALAPVLLVILAVQTALVLLLAWTVVFRFFGKDYDAAVMAGGFVGFMLGTTANALANMRAVADQHSGRFGPAARAFVVVPLVGACFIDFVNAVVITFLTGQ
jgi:ESS family glutamate:Na+ symporter